MLRAFGPEGSDLVRRWVASLLLVPEHERRAVVEAVEARVSASYAAGAPQSPPAQPMLFVRGPLRDAEGYIEEVEHAYAPAGAPPREHKSSRDGRAGTAGAGGAGGTGGTGGVGGVGGARAAS